MGEDHSQHTRIEIRNGQRLSFERQVQQGGDGQFSKKVRFISIGTVIGGRSNLGRLRVLHLLISYFAMEETYPYQGQNNAFPKIL